MNPKQRLRYFQLWQLAANAQGWSPKDERQRRKVTADCVTAIRCRTVDLATASTTALGNAEITALFVFLEHLASPSDPVASARWLECQENYLDFNLARNADHFQASAGYGKKSRISRHRFGGRGAAGAEGFEPQLTGDKLRHRVWTMANRARAKATKEQPSEPAQVDCTEPASAQQHACTAPPGADPDGEGNPFF